VIQKYLPTIALGFVATFALACISSGSAHAQQKSPIIPVPQPPTPGSVTGTDPVPPPPPNFRVFRAGSL
jgi:hypothetical protein